MQNSIILINDDPFCVWDVDLKDRCREFLRGLDPDYFEYATDAHISTTDEKRASVALRLSLHHGLETFFSLVGAFVQAPDCPYAWLSKCSTPALRTIIERINIGDPSLFTKLNVSNPSWAELARCAHLTYMPGTERQTQTIQGFSELWHRMAHEFLGAQHIDEYNSLKHGFRVRGGGFGIAFAPEVSPGVEPPAEAFTELGKSEFGSSFFKVEPLTATPGDRSLVISHQSINWSIEKIVLLNRAVYMSINNIVSALRIANDIPPSECKFLRPENQSDFLSPWNYSPSVGSTNWKRGIDPSVARSLTRKELLDALAKPEDG